MSDEKPAVFLRRITQDKLFESACSACFEVISTQACEASLAADEAKHRCNELILKEALDYFRFQPVPMMRSSRRRSQRVQ